MKAWAELSAAALLGTRRGPAKAWRDPLLSRLDVALEGASPEARLLTLAGSLSAYEASGQLPRRYLVPIAQPLDNSPRCSDETARLLAIILNGRHASLLGEVLELLAAHGQRVPEPLLPTLLERGVKAQTLHAHIPKVLGETGRWLAAQQATWFYATGKDAGWDQLLGSWQQGRDADRQLLLKQLRAKAPSQARAFLETVWSQANPNSRVWMVRALAPGLSQDDEPFLERALDDRNYTVRQRAAELLSSLPSSRLSKRMAGAARDLIHWTPEGPEPMTVALPQSLSAQLTRDGVKTPNWRDQDRVKRAQLTDLISLSPLSTWTEAWQMSPSDIIAAAQRCREARSLITGFALAAERQKAQGWAEALLKQDGLSVATVKLVTQLSPQAFEDLLEHYAPLMGKSPPFLKALNRWSRPWSETVLRLWLDYLGHSLTRPPDILVRTSFKQAARYCPLPRVAELYEQLTTFSDTDPEWQQATAEALELLTFRQHLFTSFKETA